MERKLAPDHEIAAIASRQGGVISRAQLFAIGLSRSAIDGRLRTGRLHRVARGVYAVGHTHLGDAAYNWIALLTTGETAVLSHRSAAALWGMLPPPATRVHLTVPGRGGRSRRRGLRIHRPVALRPEDITVRHDFPATSLARTFLDIAATEPRRVVERALDGADTERVFDLRLIEARIPRGCGLAGARLLWSVIDEHLPGTTISRSDYEEAMLALCRRYGLPQPVMNRHIGVWEADFLWPEYRLVVEVQSTKFHATSQRMARDSIKEGELMAAGYLVLHVVDRHIVHEPKRVAGLVAGVLRRRGASLRS